MESLRNNSFGTDNVILRNINSVYRTPHPAANAQPLGRGENTPHAKALAFQEQMRKMSLKAAAIQAHKERLTEEQHYRAATIEALQQAKWRRAEEAVESKFRQATQMRRQKFELRWLMLGVFGSRMHKMLKRCSG